MCGDYDQAPTVFLLWEPYAASRFIGQMRLFLTAEMICLALLFKSAFPSRARGASRSKCNISTYGERGLAFADVKLLRLFFQLIRKLLLILAGLLQCISGALLFRTTR